MNLCADLSIARSGLGLSQSAVAERLSVPRLAITRLEQGRGSVSLLLRVMSLLEFRVSGVAKGASLPAQICARRSRLGISVENAARKAGVDPRTVEAVERGEGTVASLIKVLNFIAPNAKRSEPPRASWGFDDAGDGERDKRFTPGWFLDKVVDAFGSIDLDPCGHELSAVEAKRRIILPECGLASRWSGRLAFVNPPYSSVVTWMDRAASAWEQGEVETIVMLVPARTDSEVFQKRVSRDADVLFLAGRIRFESTAGLAWPAPFSLMVIIWGGEALAIDRFRELVPSVRMRPWN